MVDNNQVVQQEFNRISKEVSPLENSQNKKSVFITGSTAGIGLLTAHYLIQRGHKVYLHARNEKKAQSIKEVLPNASGVLIGDLANLDELKDISQQANDIGTFDPIIHNAGVNRGDKIFEINILAPYLLTAWLNRPKQLMYLSSQDQNFANYKFDQLKNKTISYADSKLYIAIFALGLSELWTDVQINAIDPGWVPTRMGGRGAPDDMGISYRSQVDIVDGKLNIDGKLLKDGGVANRHHPLIYDESKQSEILHFLAEETGINL